MRSFARSWSVDLKERKIRVNAISPGMVVTPAFSNALGMNDAQIDQFTAQAAGRTPLGRSGTPDEIAKAVVFLASDDSSFVTGVELFVDGSLTQIQQSRESQADSRLRVCEGLVRGGCLRTVLPAE